MTEVLDYLDDIIVAARKIRQYTDGVSSRLHSKT